MQSAVLRGKENKITHAEIHFFACFIVNAAKPSHYLFDLPSYIKEKLSQLKIKNVQDVNIDTYSNYDNYASFRKSTHEGVENNGRNISLIMIDDA